jgi:hypothetical protein
MKNLVQILMVAVLGCILFVGTSDLAHAQRSGSGGGGSSSGGGGTSGGGGINRHGGSFNLTFHQEGPLIGTRSTCQGGYNLTTYVTTLSVGYKCASLDYPDGTQVYGWVYTTDYFTGLPWLPLAAGAGTVIGGKINFQNPNVVTTGINGLPVMNRMDLTLADGTVIFTGTP